MSVKFNKLDYLSFNPFIELFFFLEKQPQPVNTPAANTYP
jgi:hypothetical protein